MPNLSLRRDLEPNKYGIFTPPIFDFIIQCNYQLDGED